MSDLDVEISRLKQRAADAERGRMLADLKYQQALQDVQEASERLKEKFGVSSLEEAKELLTKLKTDYESKKVEVSALLDEFEGAR